MVRAGTRSSMETDLSLQLQQPLPGLSEQGLGVGLSQPDAHQLVLQLVERVLPGAVLPAARCARQVPLWGTVTG